jgi:cystathionine gamma-synthase
VAERKLAALENGEDGLLLASGMAAITTTLFAMLSKGAHVVVTDDAYRRTRQFLLQILRRYGIDVSVVPAGDYDRLEEAVRQTTRLFLSESPTNPYNRILDLERVGCRGRKRVADCRHRFCPGGVRLCAPHRDFHDFPEPVRDLRWGGRWPRRWR